MLTGGFARLGNRSLALGIETDVYTRQGVKFDPCGELEDAATTFGLHLEGSWRRALLGLFRQCRPDTIGLHQYRDYNPEHGWPLDLELNFTESNRSLRGRIGDICGVFEDAGLPCYRPRVPTLNRSDGSVAIIGTERLFGPRRRIVHAMTLRRREHFYELTEHGQILASVLLAEGSIKELNFGQHDVHPSAPTFVPAPGVDVKARLAFVLDQHFSMGIS